jgi:hypothetical protein
MADEKTLRRLMGCRVVLYSVVLGSVDRDSQDSCDKLYAHARSMGLHDLRDWVIGLERECKEHGKFGALAFARVIEIGLEHGFPWKEETDPDDEKEQRRRYG